MIRMLDCKVECNMGICYVKRNNTIKIDVTDNHTIEFNYSEVWPDLRVALMKAIH